MRVPDPETTPEDLIRDIYEERAAIREFCGGQDRAQAEQAAWHEAQASTGLTWLDELRQDADDPNNPDNWHRQCPPSAV